jgi:hypothetical protein
MVHNSWGTGNKRRVRTTPRNIRVDPVSAVSVLLLVVVALVGLIAEINGCFRLTTEWVGLYAILAGLAVGKSFVKPR